MCPLFVIGECVLCLSSVCPLCVLCVSFVCQEKLGLGSTGLTDADLKEFGEKIRPSNSLKILGLSSNELTRAGVEAFFKALQRQRGKPQHPLHTLILTRNRFEDGDGLQIRDAAPPGVIIKL